ncbi:hypothetical protein AUN02_04665 [Cronobacter sakazakii]|uniref:hypothetical protein n=2 Tax=Cronobacter sakazakii TaxID=28141 RepID=UPI000A1098F6|nr:hypothetical protein [Cronobacter sakazakii]EGZ6857672.1 hypothetical protein [Cronobacter sakazakii]EGZ6870466.1 hypothetical protein [Cronobacter sakazakii]ELY3417116.1 hypothetical protein [Cronobacter sakazakii]ELY3444905.1 hypothetical protein [Cronobacter sakazakii]ELY3609960.1 hypothetical protein [Cronobacter sakazakii]
MSEISNEKIQWLHDAATEFARTGMKMTMNPDEVLQLTTPLLALRERAEPVYQVQAMDWHDVEKYLYDEALDRGIRCRVLYTAPPAPVVPEWTNQQCLEFLAVAFRHAEIKGDFELDDLRLGVKMANAMTTGKEG